ncbi:unnamed protein product [Allacma fusca]|uniref:Uncharacterized protein n=1 Tax=Allacma fusca TaxID=39272 RepID=A0A8J2K055_9HEXA|nr:unnamed protein product [Allacma fusca]
MEFDQEGVPVPITIESAKASMEKALSSVNRAKMAAQIADRVAHLTQTSLESLQIGTISRQEFCRIHATKSDSLEPEYLLEGQSPASTSTTDSWFRVEELGDPVLTVQSYPYIRAFQHQDSQNLLNNRNDEDSSQAEDICLNTVQLQEIKSEY